MGMATLHLKPGGTPHAAFPAGSRMIVSLSGDSGKRCGRAQVWGSWFFGCRGKGARLYLAAPCPGCARVGMRPNSHGRGRSRTILAGIIGG